MRDLHLHIDRDRLALAHDTARLLERGVLFAQQFSLLLDYDAVVLYECMCHDPLTPSKGSNSEFFWRGQDAAIVAMGHVAELAEVDSFEALGEQMKAWREMCVERTSERALCAVGGLGFDAASGQVGDTSSWRGYGPGKFWVPRCMLRGEQGKYWVLTLCLCIDPKESLDELEARVKREGRLAEAWLAGADHHRVSRETSRLEVTTSEPGRARWGELVEHAASTMRQTPLDKVVLARRVEIDFDRRVRPSLVLEQLIEIHPSCKVFLVRPEHDGGIVQRFLGASPECLVEMHGGRLYVDALAGSAPVDVSDEALLSSDKDRQEHALVVQEIEQALGELAELEVGQTRVDALANIKHLRTPISGKVSAGAGLATLAGALHPTPAVCGKPRHAALDYLREHEYGAFLERGWYAGVVGWTGLEGQDGEFYVALRCGLLHQDHATLFVGAGIMPDSSPESELTETSNKARAMLAAFERIGARP